MNSWKFLLAIITFPFIMLTASAQDIPNIDDPADDAIPPAISMDLQVGKTYYKGDSIPKIILPTFNKFQPLVFRNQKERDRYNRLVANVKRLLPLAKLAKLTVIETYDYMQTIPVSERKAYLRDVENGLKKQYAPTLKRMTRSQGKLFIKLIDRECGQTGYNIAQAFIGSFKANLYQGVAVFFGQSLTKRYDPEGDDRYTERVVRLVESGQL